MKQKIPVSSIQPGSRYSATIWDKKDNVLLPANHSVHPIYIDEWRVLGEFVFTDGEVIENTEELKKELPGYIDKETRELLQEYYNNIAPLKELYQNVSEITLEDLKKITFSWASYAIKKNNLSIFLKVSRYAIFSEKDYFFVHSIDTMLIALGIYKQFYKNVTVSDLMRLATSAILSNIGMLLLPTGLIEDKVNITEQQKQEIQKHPLLGYKFLVSQLGFPTEVALPALEHHERPDGSGYPNHLKGDQLHPNSIIISLSDVFTAQMHQRTFKDGREPVEILKDFIQTIMPIFPQAYSPFVSAFVSFITIYPTTSILELDTNEVVIVTKTYPEFPTRPKVMVLLDKEKNIATSINEFRLSDEENHNINIVGTYTKTSLNSLNKK